MIWLSVVGFLVAAMAAGFVVRWVRGHASAYGNGMPQRFHMGDVPRLGGAALLLGLACAWGLGILQSFLGDPGSLKLGWWVGSWLLVLLPAVLGGIAEDMTQRLAVRYRLALTGASGLLAIFLLDLSVPRLGLPLAGPGHRGAGRGGAAPCLQHHRRLQRPGRHGRHHRLPGPGARGIAGG